MTFQDNHGALNSVTRLGDIDVMQGFGLGPLIGFAHFIGPVTGLYHGVRLQRAQNTSQLMPRIFMQLRHGQDTDTAVPIRAPG